MISTHTNTGAYGFADGETLRSYCAQLLDHAVGHAGEYYTTNIIPLNPMSHYSGFRVFSAHEAAVLYQKNRVIHK